MSQLLNKFLNSSSSLSNLCLSLITVEEHHIMKMEERKEEKYRQKPNHDLGYLKGAYNYTGNHFIFSGLSKTKTKHPHLPTPSWEL